MKNSLIKLAVVSIGFWTSHVSVTKCDEVHEETETLYSPMLDSTSLHHIDVALNVMKMTLSDLSFQKDHVKSDYLFGKSRELLHNPLHMDLYGQSLHRRLRESETIHNLTDVSSEVLDNFHVAKSSPTINKLSSRDPLKPISESTEEDIIDEKELKKIPPELRATVTELVKVIESAHNILQNELPAKKDREMAIAALASAYLNIDDDPAQIDEWASLGMDVEAIRKLQRRSINQELQDDELTRTLFEVADNFNYNAVQSVFSTLTEAVDRAIADLKGKPFWDTYDAEIHTKIGDVYFGGVGNNIYQKDALLIIDMGGDDIYENAAGRGNGLLGKTVSIVIDCDGNDQYRANQSFSQGSGVFGVGILADLGGDDRYLAKTASQGAGLFGFGVLLDVDGKDAFEAKAVSQGAGMFGSGILWQKDGETSYQAESMSQGFAGIGGFGLLLDEDGADKYEALGKYPCTWLEGHKFSLSQGFSIGMRPFAGGGLGLLVDFNGNDHYVADVYGQGASYWYSTGMLLDMHGNDVYEAYQYCQGAGIHLSNGALFDWEGEDRYTAKAICQGGAHDYSTGILIDLAGNDSYEAATTAQGSAINNSVAILFDRKGNDRYVGTDPSQSQAAGHNGGKREYGSIALLLDLSGTDTYSQGRLNGDMWLKPFHGIGWDTEVSTNDTITSRPALRESSQFPEVARRKYKSVDVNYSTERLLRRASRDAKTKEEKQDAAAAWEELKQQGTNALPYLLTRVDSPNIMLTSKIEEFINGLETNAVPSLIECISLAAREETARLCTYFIARFENATNAVPNILPLLNQSNSMATAFYTLGHLSAREALQPAVQALSSDREIVRLRAVQAIGRIAKDTDLEVLPVLLNALEDPVWSVRYAAEDALVALGPSIIKPIQDRLQAQPRIARRHTLDILARLGYKQALALARTELENEPAPVRYVIEQQLRSNLREAREKKLIARRKNQR